METRRRLKGTRWWKVRDLNCWLEISWTSERASGRAKRRVLSVLVRLACSQSHPQFFSSPRADVPLGEAGKNWMRPAPSAIDPSADAIVFQQLECDYTSGAPNRVHYLGGGSEGDGLEEAPIVRMFGVNRAGNSVCVFVHGFEPYFYVEAPTPAFSPDDCTNLQEVLNAALGSRYVVWCFGSWASFRRRTRVVSHVALTLLSPRTRDRSKNAKSVLKVEIVHKQTILY